MDEVKKEEPKKEEPAFSLGQPIAVTLFGIFNIAIGGLSLLTSPCTIFGIAVSAEAYGMSVGYALFILLTYIAGLSLYVWMLFLGEGLIMLRGWARGGCVKFAWTAIIWWVFRRGMDILALSAGWVNPPEGNKPVFIAKMCVSLFGLIYAVLLLVFIKSAKVKQSFAAAEG
jgi:hypothetical protein